MNNHAGATPTTCPACGETEQIVGTPHEGDIKLSCQRCGQSWLRGGRRCRGCGGTALVRLPQVMSRTPRGNQLAFIGAREIDLCPECDGTAVTESTTSNRPIAESYHSIYLLGPPTATPIAPSIPSPPAPKAGPATRGSERNRSGHRQQRTSAPAASPSTAPARVNEALTALTNDEGVDVMVLVLLGRLLGTTTPLATLDSPHTAPRIAEWYQTTFARSPKAEAARLTIQTIASRWRQKGWVTEDLASELPPP